MTLPSCGRLPGTTRTTLPRHLVAGAGLSDLDDDALVEEEAVAGRALIGDEPEIGGGVALQRGDSGLGEFGALRAEKGFARDQRLGQRRQRDAELHRLVEDD